MSKRHVSVPISIPAAIIAAFVAAGVAIGAVAGRYHYVIDVLLGIVVAGVVTSATALLT